MIIAKKTNKKQAASYCLSFALHELLLYAVNAFLSPVTATVILLDSLSYLYILFDKISLEATSSRLENDNVSSTILRLSSLPAGIRTHS